MGSYFDIMPHVILMVNMAEGCPHEDLDAGTLIRDNKPSPKDRFKKNLNVPTRFRGFDSPKMSAQSLLPLVPFYTQGHN